MMEVLMGQAHWPYGTKKVLHGRGRRKAPTSGWPTDDEPAGAYFGIAAHGAGMCVRSHWRRGTKMQRWPQVRGVPSSRAALATGSAEGVGSTSMGLAAGLVANSPRSAASTPMRLALRRRACMEYQRRLIGGAPWALRSLLIWSVASESDSPGVWLSTLCQMHSGNTRAAGPRLIVLPLQLT